MRKVEWKRGMSVRVEWAMRELFGMKAKEKMLMAKVQ